jgi:hypothetical protein
MGFLPQATPYTGEDSMKKDFSWRKINEKGISNDTMMRIWEGEGHVGRIKSTSQSPAPSRQNGLDPCNSCFPSRRERLGAPGHVVNLPSARDEYQLAGLPSGRSLRTRDPVSPTVHCRRTSRTHSDVDTSRKLDILAVHVYSKCELRGWPLAVPAHCIRSRWTRLNTTKASPHPSSLLGVNVV